MKGKLTANFQLAMRFLHAGYVLVLVPTNDELIPGFQVIVRDEALKVTAEATKGFVKTAPQALFAMTVLSENKPSCYLVEELDPQVILKAFRDAGHEIAFEE